MSLTNFARTRGDTIVLDELLTVAMLDVRIQPKAVRPPTSELGAALGPNLAAICHEVDLWSECRYVGLRPSIHLLRAACFISPRDKPRITGSHRCSRIVSLPSSCRPSCSTTPPGQRSDWGRARFRSRPATSSASGYAPSSRPDPRLRRTSLRRPWSTAATKWALPEQVV